MKKELRIEPAFQLDRRIEAVHTELSQVMGTLHLMSENAKKADIEDTLSCFCDLLADRINWVKACSAMLWKMLKWPVGVSTNRKNANTGQLQPSLDDEVHEQGDCA